jgi:pyridoxamine 5'-phosphate oxidase
MNGPQPIPRDDLAAIAADLWVRLGQGKTDRNAPFHTPVVGTADGEMRVMVLRHVDARAGVLRFHTDIRSPKAAAVGGGAPVSLLFYDAAAKLQLRCSGIGTVVKDGPVADAAWGASAPSSRRCYLAALGPSSSAAQPTSGLPAAFEDRLPTLAESEAGRGNFAVLLVTLTRIDWLYLAHDGHRRALFQRSGDQWAGGWLVP